jgi:hypothetical protein
MLGVFAPATAKWLEDIDAIGFGLITEMDVAKTVRLGSPTSTRHVVHPP